MLERRSRSISQYAHSPFPLLITPAARIDCFLSFQTTSFHRAFSCLLTHASPALQVQSGGSFDVDYEVVGPKDRVIMEGKKERQGDFVFTATEVGEYRACFDNDMSTVTDKMVDFELAVRLVPFLPSNFCLPFTMLLGINILHHRLHNYCVRSLTLFRFPIILGRRRIPLRLPPPEARHHARADLRARRIALQGVRPTVHHLAKPEILPHAGE